MTIHFLTIVLDGMPWLPTMLTIFNRLKVDWQWHVVEGVASNTHCTKWCKEIDPRYSVDGTTEFLDQALTHERVRLYRKLGWDGKIEMVNEPLHHAKEPGLVWEVDSDEMWQPWQIEKMAAMFQADPSRTHAQFKCRYFFGPDIIITSENTYGNHFDYEWFRVWRWRPGQLFLSHEPPQMGGSDNKPFTVAETSGEGLVFDHYAYATEEQVAFKERYYGYAGAVAAWRRLQGNKTWPVQLRDYIPWIKDNATADKLWKL